MSRHKDVLDFLRDHRDEIVEDADAGEPHAKAIVQLWPLVENRNLPIGALHQSTREWAKQKQGGLINDERIC